MEVYRGEDAANGSLAAFGDTAVVPGHARPSPHPGSGEPRARREHREDRKIPEALPLPWPHIPQGPAEVYREKPIQVRAQTIKGSLAAPPVWHFYICRNDDCMASGAACTA